MEIEHVISEDRTFVYCHASTLIERKNGEILVGWFGGTSEGNSDTAIWLADRPSLSMQPTDFGTTSGLAWSKPRVAAPVERAPQSIRLPHWNPVLFRSSPAVTVLHYKVGKNIRSWQTWVQLSADEGQTWGPATPLVPDDCGGRGAVKNKPIQLRSGAWLAGASLESWREWDAFVDRSANGIDAWEASQTIHFDRARYPTKGIIQPTLWQNDDGVVHALFRSTGGKIFASHSYDDGRSWREARPTELTNNNSGIDAVRLESGLIALACNPVSEGSLERTPLSILFSSDDGQTWPDRLDIETSPGEYSYPALISTQDGLCLSYTWNRHRIAVARLAWSELPTL